MDVDTSPHTEMVQFIQTLGILINIENHKYVFSKSLKILNTISNEGERSSKTPHGSQAKRFNGKSKGEESKYS